MKKFYTIILSVLLLNSCSDDPVFPIEPDIEFVSITPAQAVQFQDELTITIHFQDGDGDLGFENDPVPNLFVRDTRTDIPDSLRISSFSIPNLTPDTHRPSIQGPMSIQLLCPPHPSFLPPGNNAEEDVVFQIWLVDRAGHVSDTVLTSPVRILQ